MCLDLAFANTTALRKSIIDSWVLAVSTLGSYGLPCKWYSGRSSSSLHVQQQNDRDELIESTVDVNVALKR